MNQVKKRKKSTQSQIRTIYRILEQYQLIECTLSPTQKSYQVCALFPTRYWLAVLETLRLTAIRVSQLVSLRIKDFDFKEYFFTLCSESSKNHREYQVVLLRSLRDISQSLVEKMVENGAKPNDLLFDVHRFSSANPSNQQTSLIQTVRSFFRRLSKECGFHVTPHRFRHTLATTLMKHPERNMQLTKQVLGHRSLSSTLEYISLDTYTTAILLENELSDLSENGIKRGTSKIN